MGAIALEQIFAFNYSKKLFITFSSLFIPEAFDLEKQEEGHRLHHPIHWVLLSECQSTLSSTAKIALFYSHPLPCLGTQSSPALLKPVLFILASLSMLSEMFCCVPRVCHIDSLQRHHPLPVGLVLPSQLWFITSLCCSHTTLSSLSHMGLLMRYAWW